MKKIVAVNQLAFLITPYDHLMVFTVALLTYRGITYRKNNNFLLL